MNISFLLEITIAVSTIMGMIFSIFIYFKNPQIQSDKNDALMGQSIHQLQLDLTNLRDNHLHTLDQKIDSTISSVNTISIEVAKLGTIINERIPSKS